MIARVWHGSTKPADADRYVVHLRQNVLPELRAIAGFRGERAISILYGAKIVLGVTLLLLAFLFRDVITTNSVLRLVVLLAGGFVGFCLPNLSKYRFFIFNTCNQSIKEFI